jgi:hypothetical protein
MKAARVATWTVVSLSFSLACGRLEERPGGGRRGGDGAVPEARGPVAEVSRGGDSIEILVDVTDVAPIEVPGVASDAAPADRVPADASVEVPELPISDAASADTDLAREPSQDAEDSPADHAAPEPADDAADGPARDSGVVAVDLAPGDVDLADDGSGDANDSRPDEAGGSADAPQEDPGEVRADDAGGETGGSTGSELVGAPLIVAPTSHGFRLNVVLASGDPSALRARVRKQGGTAWTDVGKPVQRAPDLAEWSATGLEAGQRYEYEILAAGPLDGGGDPLLYRGSAVTQRDPGESFVFDVLTDSHIEPCDPIPFGTAICEGGYLSSDEGTLLEVAADIGVDRPDFLIHTGDMLDYHRFGFNDPPPDSHWARLAYLNYRRLLGDTLGNAAHFPTIGNWDGESGHHSPEEIERSSSQRMLYAPAAGPGTYPEGGSPNQDYYAFTWGNALFVVLNVMTYTTTAHLLGVDPGVPDDWTLGKTQRSWLEDTLAGTTSKWRFLFIHHPVGGNGGNETDSAYGRGGGRAAYVGEQALVHRMMQKYGVQIFFYGHDHVFTDMVVDGIHYTLPGSAGAPWKFDTSTTGYTEYLPDSGHGRVTVSPDSVTVDFVAAGGTLLSSYTLK